MQTYFLNFTQKLAFLPLSFRQLSHKKALLKLFSENTEMKAKVPVQIG